MSETTVLVELLKQSPTLAAILWMLYTFFRVLKEEREACAKERAESRKENETSRAESRADFLAELKRTHEMYQQKGCQ